MFYEIFKAKDTGKFLVSKIGAQDSGYYFDRKDFEVLNLKISDF